MFEWINAIIANIAYETAIESAGLASSNGMHEIEVPVELQKLLEENQ